jgi:hypothetical protein
MTTELACGRTVEEAAALTDTTVIHALDGLPPGKEHCSMLAVRGLQLALQNAVLRLLFKRAGIVDSDEAFDRLVESGEINRGEHHVVRPPTTFDTACIDAGQHPDDLFGGVSVPIYQSSTFAFAGSDLQSRINANV